MSKLFKVFMAIFGVILVYGIVASRINRDPNDHSTAVERQANYEKYVANKPIQEPVTTNIPAPTKTAEQRQQQSANHVAQKYIAQYEIAKGNGDKPRKCALAGLVATAYLNANDSENYRLWHYYEEQDCK